MAEWMHTHTKVLHATMGRASSADGAQERLLNLTIAEDARVSRLESLYVRLTLAECRRVEEEAPATSQQRSRRFPLRPTRGFLVHFQAVGWEVLNSIDLEEVFQNKFPVLQNCPDHVRGRFRQVARHAHAVMSRQDRSGEV